MYYVFVLKDSFSTYPILFQPLIPLPMASLRPFHAARTQPIICNSTPDMIKAHFLPIAEKLKENAINVEAMERRLAQEKRMSLEGSEDFEQYVQEVMFLLNYCLYLYVLLCTRYLETYYEEKLISTAQKRNIHYLIRIKAI